MKTLFTEDCRYTAEAMNLDSDTWNLLKDTFNAYLEKGFSPREISHIMQGTIRDLECSAVLDNTREFNNLDTKNRDTLPEIEYSSKE